MPRSIARKSSKKRGADLSVPVPRGNLWLHELRSRVFGNTRLVRVWLPPDYDGWGATRYPVLYMNDGQNLFDPATAFAGVHWQVGETAARLIGEKKIPPLIVVAIDNTGKSRACEYTPYKSRDPRVLRPEGARYPEFLQREVMPLIEEHYSILKGPENTGLGGSSRPERLDGCSSRARRCLWRTGRFLRKFVAHTRGPRACMWGWVRGRWAPRSETQRSSRMCAN